MADAKAEEKMGSLQELITQIRRLKKEYSVPEGKEVVVLLQGAPRDFGATLDSEEWAIRLLARVSEVRVGETGAGRAGAHGVLNNGTELFIPLEGVIDLEAEKERLEGEIRRLEGQLRGSEKKLENSDFLEKAPARIVEREREKAASFREQMEKLQEKLQAFEGV
jgi:valyl-tRNA synthetase